MAEDSAIGWCHDTFNPWWGCKKVSPACGLPLPGEENLPHEECYAMLWAARCGYSETGTRFPIWGQHVKRRLFDSETHWKAPLKWQRSAAADGVVRRVFCGSMCDILEDRPDVEQYRQWTFDLVRQTPNLLWLFLTKRPENALKLFPAEWLDRWPDNAKFGITAENQDWLSRRWPHVMDLYERTCGLKIFLSCEPLLGPLEFEGDMDLIEWVICGGASGPNARSMRVQWAESLRDQCARTGTAFFMKQLGTQPIWAGAAASPTASAHGKGDNPEEWPESLRVQDFPR